MRTVFQILALLLCGTANIWGQTKLIQEETDERNHVSFARFATDTVIPITNAPELLKKIQPEVREVDEWKLSTKRKEIKDDNNSTHTFYQQYYKGIKVEGGEFSVHATRDSIRSILGVFEWVGDLDINAKLSEQEALEYALKYTGAEIYKWQVPEEEVWIKEHYGDTFYPKGELVVVKDRLNTNSKYCLAYKFSVYAHKPMSSNYVWVDAITGEIVNIESRIFYSNASGTAATRYSGTRIITTDSYNGGFRLKETRMNTPIQTYNMHWGVNFNNATDFVDNDNNWTAAEYNNANRDNAALDAHWGAEMVYDYFKQVHNRNSWDGNGGAIWGYVNANMYGLGLGTSDNAFWSPQDHRMVYGYGTNSPLTTLDICAHEFAHGVCEATAGLPNSGESGAINESLSDIWAACVENYVNITYGLSKNVWLLGEDTGSASRSLSNPNLFGQPDTYDTSSWNSNADAHLNSGVGNFWFFLLSQGGNGTNDLNNVYSVAGIGITKAAAIAYKAETSYLTSYANYAQFRNATISAATDLYGVYSSEEMAVTNAWHAVGVGNRFQYISVFGPATFYSTATFQIQNLPVGATVDMQTSYGLTASASSSTITVTADPTSYFDNEGWLQIDIEKNSLIIFSVLKRFICGEYIGAEEVTSYHEVESIYGDPWDSEEPDWCTNSIGDENKFRFSVLNEAYRPLLQQIRYQARIVRRSDQVVLLTLPYTFSGEEPVFFDTSGIGIPPPNIMHDIELRVCYYGLGGIGTTHNGVWQKAGQVRWIHCTDTGYDLPEE
ncbi:MAG: M4 family metallopeptidase [Mediterranea sp.]|jgi:Zn-dependent metalloprotease|nr:M4 family metallopeptidase [Mediterranea sp.]